MMQFNRFYRLKNNYEWTANIQFEEGKWLFKSMITQKYSAAQFICHSSIH